MGERKPRERGRRKNHRLRKVVEHLDARLENIERELEAMRATNPSGWGSVDDRAESRQERERRAVL